MLTPKPRCHRNPVQLCCKVHPQPRLCHPAARAIRGYEEKRILGDGVVLKVDQELGQVLAPLDCALEYPIKLL